MRVLADALRLPLSAASVDVIISNPPYPGNGVWDGDWQGGVRAAVKECQRVLRPAGRGWFLLGIRRVAEQWLTFDKTLSWWAHEGSSDFPPTPLPGRCWGVVPDADVAPLILAHSHPGGVVLDPFAGRGGIPKLAARLGRVPLGMDIDADQLESGGPYRCR